MSDYKGIPVDDGEIGITCAICACVFVCRYIQSIFFCPNCGSRVHAESGEAAE